MAQILKKIGNVLYQMVLLYLKATLFLYLPILVLLQYLFHPIKVRILFVQFRQEFLVEALVT